MKKESRENWGEIELTPIKPEYKNDKEYSKKLFETVEEIRKDFEEEEDLKMTRRAFLFFGAGLILGPALMKGAEKYKSWQKSIDDLRKEVQDNPQKREEMIRALKKESEESTEPY